MEKLMTKTNYLGFLFLSGSLLLSSLMFADNSYAAHKKGKQYDSYGGTAFIFSPRSHSWKAVSNGRVIRSGRASGGMGYCPDIGRSCRTPTGTYFVHSKGGPDCVSSRYPVGGGGAKMPYCMFFSQYYAIHGSYDVPNRNASHGCIRVTPGDALWLTRNFVKVGTKVIITSY
jgi:hypothetical protein